MSSAWPKFIRRLMTFVIPACSLLSPVVVCAQQEQAPGAMLQEEIAPISDVRGSAPGTGVSRGPRAQIILGPFWAPFCPLRH